MKKARRFTLLTVSIIVTFYLLILSITSYIQFFRAWGFFPLDLLFIGGASVLFVFFMRGELGDKTKSAKSAGWKRMMLGLALFVILFLFYWGISHTAPRYFELMNSLWPFVFAGFFLALFIKGKRRKPTYVT